MSAFDLAAYNAATAFFLETTSTVHEALHEAIETLTERPDLAPVVGRLVAGPFPTATDPVHGDLAALVVRHARGVTWSLIGVADLSPLESADAMLSIDVDTSRAVITHRVPVRVLSCGPRERLGMLVAACAAAAD